MLRVGPGQTYSTVKAASQAAQNGDLVEIQAGTYLGDVMTWSQSNLTIRGVGGRPVLDANGVSAQGKGIFVTQGGGTIKIENIEFANAKVPDENGAGIRQENLRLVLCNVSFRGNEEGILTDGGTNTTLEVYDSQFIGNAFAYAGGYSHSIYVGRMSRLTLVGNYFTRTEIGHLVKSRARENFILYNRITDESAGSASYEIDLPDGGVSYVVGNIIEQSAGTDNPTIISYGAESLSTWPSNQIYVSHNTIINRRNGSCNWLTAGGSSTVLAVNNLITGFACGTSVPSGATMTNNRVVPDTDFVSAATYDFRLKTTSTARNTAVAAGTVNGVSLVPVREYRHTASSFALTGAPAHPGAIQSAP